MTRNHASRAMNQGRPLLALKHGIPQFSVRCTFTNPRPQDVFLGQSHRIIDLFQAQAQILLRSGTYNNEFYVWVEPRSINEKDDQLVLEQCVDAQAFLQSWERKQKDSITACSLTEYYDLWKLSGQLIIEVEHTFPNRVDGYQDSTLTNNLELADPQGKGKQIETLDNAIEPSLGPKRKRQKTETEQVEDDIEGHPFEIAC